MSLPTLSAQALPVVGDAQVNSTYPTTNFGTLPYMQVGGTSAAYVKFDTSSLAGLEPSNILRARLILWTNRVGVAGAIDVSEVSSPWDEPAITQSATPTVVGSAMTVPVSRAATFVAADITARVQKWMSTPSANFGVAITAAAGSPLTVVYFDTKESVSTSHAPQLEICFVRERGRKVRTETPVQPDRLDPPVPLGQSG